MGLDITAYKKLTMVENPKLDEDGYPENWETEWKPGEGMVWSESCFPGSGEGVIPHTVYTYEDSFGFRAGSYSGYGWWRDKLEGLSDGNSFYELTNFADNEGVIGSVVSKKLYNDFISNSDNAEKYSKLIGEDGKYWLEKYKSWTKAFEMASDDGAVDFH